MRKPRCLQTQLIWSAPKNLWLVLEAAKVYCFSVNPEVVTSLLSLLFSCLCFRPLNPVFFRFYFWMPINSRWCSFFALLPRSKEATSWFQKFLVFSWLKSSPPSKNRDLFSRKRSFRFSFGTISSYLDRLSPSCYFFYQIWLCYPNWNYHVPPS